MWSRIWHNLLSQTSMLLLYVWDRQVRCVFYVSQRVETWVGGAVWCPGFLFPSTLRWCGCLSSGTCHRVAAHVACWPTGTYQCWAVLTFLWEPAGSGSYILLWEPDQFSSILFSGWEPTRLSRFQNFPNSPGSHIPVLPFSRN
jgi:hypothetical protein